MQGMGGGECPFSFNSDPATFAVGDMVSYRVEGMDDFPFAGRLIAVHEDHVVISTDLEGGDDADTYRATRAARPFVSAQDVQAA